ncbi:endonuclease/exonuclease/phosphatase family protein [Elioraea sp.]|uniref:endonuclease/exonuclease/phosphatase family protein n=1 Tax=Elioraea sp. TaxID=2185103 RepID=UPI0025BE6D13|nr:endonuclease/exonuclease/phosphatase family protein [Elioraea sp.]
MTLAVLIIGLALVAVTALSRVRSARWWIRAADFPRAQIAVGLVLTLAAFAPYASSSSIADIGFALALIAALGYQLSRIWPYTPIAPRQVLPATPGDDGRTIRILIWNVLMQNREARAFLDLVHAQSPDVILLLETDAWWDEALRGLDGAYAHAIRHPLENEYGLHLFSRLGLIAPQLEFLVEPDIPSVRAGVRLRSGDVIVFHGLHPRPPLPQQDAEPRDAEILMVGRQVKPHAACTIVAGDLNDVAWSDTTRLFQRLSGMLDPRRGRGLFNTFHAGYPLLRWPLDHVFHGAGFTLVGLRRLPRTGSDHFPVLVDLKYTPEDAGRHETEQADRQDQAEAQERIVEGLDAATRRNGSP